MSRTQEFLKRVLPEKWAADMEAESRSWMIKCSKCGNEMSVWDVGGVRWKAAGNPKKVMRCRKCGQVALHEIYRKLES
ncbi:MAG: hypothetical protein GC204_18900 [Chloroflexi bacterium]|nr:hypothetical protein [Chloroflexota bacterium]